jgi:hypothetical protein
MFAKLIGLKGKKDSKFKIQDSRFEVKGSRGTVIENRQSRKRGFAFHSMLDVGRSMFDVRGVHRVSWICDEQLATDCFLRIMD